MNKIKKYIKTLFPNYLDSRIFNWYLDMQNMILSSPLCLRFSKINYKKPQQVGITDTVYVENVRVIVSLTSFPERIKYVHRTLYSILQQKSKPNMVILWLADSQFPNRINDIPEELVDLEKYGLSIRWTEDIRSYKKLIPMLKLEEFKDDIIVTADDDIYYPEYWLESLIESYKKNHHAIHCGLITKTEYTNNKIIFQSVLGKKGDGSCSYKYKVLGCGGILYPPHCFYKDVICQEKFLKLAPTNDDVWFWLMAVKNGYTLCWILNNMKELHEIAGVSKNSPALYKINNLGENRRLKETVNVLNEYDLWWIYGNEEG